MLNWTTGALKLHWKALLIWLLGILLPLMLFGYIAEDLLEKETFRFEKPLMLWLHGFSSPWLDAVGLTLMTVGGIKVIGPISVLVCLFALSHRKNYGMYFLYATLGAGILNAVLKLSFQRTRPQLWDLLVHEPSASFPSGHAMYSAAIGTALICLLWHTRYRWHMLVFGVLFAFFVGLSRIYLGVHYPTDVLAGWAAGTAWSLVLWRILSSRWQTNPVCDMPSSPSPTES